MTTAGERRVKKAIHTMKTYTQLCSSNDCMSYTGKLSARYTSQSYLEEYLYAIGEEEPPFQTEE